MQMDSAIIAISCFASGRDVAVGVMVPATRQVRVLWVGESRIEHREIPSNLWTLLEFEVAIGSLPRRLGAGSAIARALFDDDRRRSTTTELVTRVSLPRPEGAGLLDAIDELLCRVTCDMRTPPADSQPRGKQVTGPVRRSRQK